MSVSAYGKRFGAWSDNAKGQPLRRMKRTVLLTLLVLFPLLALVGCGRSEKRVPVFPVSGKVKFQGSAPAGAQVVLHPVNATEPSDVAPSGLVKEDGAFQITSYLPGDGAPAGDYVVTLQWFKIVPEEGGRGPNVFPKDYADPKKSPVKVSVKGGPTVVPDIEIK